MTADEQVDRGFATMVVAILVFADDHGLLASDEDQRARIVDALAQDNAARAVVGQAAIHLVRAMLEVLQQPSL